MKAAIGIALAALLICAAPAAAQESGQPFAPWDGTNPFRCTIQDVGTGTDFPDPNADPFCVEFDKTQQNVTDLGILDFLSKEPARTAAAVNKCFYFQTDHWTGSIVQGEQPELWHWDGQYFFDKAIGAGGVNITNFRILGQPASIPPDQLPDSFQPYFDQGGGGALLVMNMPADPNCAARVDTPEERAQIYANASPPVTTTARTPGAGGVGTSAFAKHKKKKCRKKRRMASPSSRGCKRPRHTTARGSAPR
jgi:hypothetical protein